MTTFRWSLEEDVQHYSDAGIEAIGVWRQKVSDFGEDKGVELLKDSGLTVSSLMWAGGFTGSDGRSYKESVSDAREAVQLAARMGTDCLLVYSGPRAGHTHNHARRLLRSALSELLVDAADLGVTLALEPMHEGCAAEWTFLTSIDETLQVITELNHPRLKLAFDTYHFGCDLARLHLSDFVDKIAIVHLGDTKAPPQGEQNRCRLGEGMVAFSEIISQLQAAKYNGFFEIELMGEEIEITDYVELLNRSKVAFESWAGVVKNS